MKRLAPTIIILLMCLVTSGQQQPGIESADADVNPIQPAAADGLWVGIGPDMKVLPLGTYRFLFIPADPAKQVNVTTVTTGTGTPGEPDPPPTGDLSSKVAASLSKVTDAGKKKTAGNLVTMYEEFIKSADAGSISNVGQLATAIQMLTTITTTGKAGWSDFSTLVTTTLSESNTMAASATALKTFVAELKRVT